MDNNSNNKKTTIVGYSGHGFVAVDILLAMKMSITTYCDDDEKTNNPFHLSYLGKEKDFFSSISYLNNQHTWQFFISIGNNNIREKVFSFLMDRKASIINAIHPKAIIASSCIVGSGVMAAANTTVNPICKIGNGVICNTSCSIDHECIIDDFAHIAPGAVLNGNVKIGKRTFIGANATIKQGVQIGNDVTIGMGACVVKNISEPGIYIGNPAKLLVK
jgi:sugar O-acyltransferase (sialic acid O-acetyltransferase NeuD family)